MTRDQKLKLLVATHCVYAGRNGGIEHMIYNLLNELVHDCDITMLCGNSTNLNARVSRRLRDAGASILERGGDSGPRFVSEQRACLSADLHADATLFPNYFIPPITPARLGKLVCVIHDMQFRHLPQNFSARKRVWLRSALGLTMHKADQIVVVSEFVRQHAIQVYGRLADKIVVIPPPISWQRFEIQLDDPPELPMDRPYVLAVAAQYPHKNLEVLLRSFAQINLPDVALVLCGQYAKNMNGDSQGRTDIPKLVADLGLEARVHLTGYVDDATLGRWYRGASVFAFPSLYEGFGMPPVEALGMGLPTLTTRCASLPESTLGLASYVADPKDCREWASRLVEMVRNPNQYKPAPDDVIRLRTKYDPASIARDYIDACK